MKSAFLSSILSAILVIICTEYGYAKLVLLQTLFRHGDRSPTGFYPNDPNSPKFWKEGLGMLTELGRVQHYTLGKQIRSLYPDFITSSPIEVIVNSTGIDRCLRSAESHVAGLYAPTKEWQFIPGLNWQPIPINYLKAETDAFLNPVVDCPRAHQEEQRIFDAEPFQEFLKYNGPMLKNLSICSGKDLSHSSASKLQNTLEIEAKYNLTIPSCMQPYTEQLASFSDVYHFSIYGNPIIQRLRAGPFLGQVIERMKNKVAGNIPNLKVQVYSARDRNVAATLVALDIFNNRHPPYCATVLFELHHKKDEGYSVRLLIMNSTRPEDGNQEPHLLQLNGCGEYCPLDDFVRNTKHLVPEDYEKECQLDSESDDSDSDSDSDGI